MSAYAETYLMDAMENLGEMTDCAATIMELPLSRFWQAFVSSELAPLVCTGDPRTIVGLSGTEMAVRVCEQAGIPIPDRIFRSPIEQTLQGQSCPSSWNLGSAFWCGWVLAFYQWRSCLSFADIERGLPIDKVERMYRTLHEASEERFADAADEIIASVSCCGIKRLRTNAGLSQSQLAKKSGVGLRAIQQYEQGTKSVQRASVESIMRLSRALQCTPDDLLFQPSGSYEYAFIELSDSPLAAHQQELGERPSALE